MIEVDVRGFSCPIRVIRTKKVVDERSDEPYRACRGGCFEGS